MSITDELREYAKRWPLIDYIYRDMLAIADRIDAEHEAKVSYWQGACYKDGYDEGFASADDWLAQHEDAMAEHGWVKLPNDADGESLDEGDFVEVIGEGYVTSIEWFALKGMEWYAGLSAHTEFCADGSVDKIWMSNYVKASELRKDRPAPTVEDVLQEFVDKYAFYSAIDIHPDLKAHEEVLRQFAAKLRLAGDGDE